jgi:RND family efflux transporter MFP subunit
MRKGAVIAAIALALATVGVAARLINHADLRERAEDAATPTVSVVPVKLAPPTQELVLPGTVEAWAEAPLYARTNGYLKKWNYDIGAQVKAGDVLAEIETPEVDQQTRQAEADLAQAQANEQLAKSTADRYQDLFKQHYVSKQDLDDRISNLAAKRALLDSAKANLQRLKETQGFQKIVAPFDGTVTARRTDVGQLVSNGGAGAELFHIADTRKLRIYVQVPQSYAPSAQPGVDADLRFAEHPDRPYPAKIVRTANAIDPSTRSLLTQLEVDNAKGELLPGAYAEVHLKLPGPTDTLRIPANALIFRAEGMQVATVTPDNKVALKNVTLGRDFGTEVEVLGGVGRDDKLIVNPPDSITADMAVRVAQESAPAGKGPGGSKP